MSGLDAVPVRLGEQTLSVKLDGMRVVEVRPAGEAERVTCTLVVRRRQGDLRQSESLGTPGILKMVEAARLSGHTEASRPWSPLRTGG